MTLNLGDNAVKRLYVGDNVVKRVYLGDNQVWSGSPEFRASNSIAGPVVVNATSVSKCEVDVTPETTVVFALWFTSSFAGMSAGLTFGGVPMVNTGIQVGTVNKYSLYKLENPPNGTVEVNGYIYGFAWFWGSANVSRVAVFGYENVTSIDAILTKNGGPGTGVSHNAGYNSEGTLVQILAAPGATPTAANFTPQGYNGDGRLGPVDSTNPDLSDIYIYDTPALNYNQTFTETLSSSVAWNSTIIKLSGD